MLKRSLSLIFFFIFLSFSSLSFSIEIRKPAKAGTFYPLDKNELEDTIKDFLSNIEKKDLSGKIFAILVPHAGYAYSGEIAAHAYKNIIGRKTDTVILICNSHTTYFKGAAIDSSDFWENSLGRVAVNKKLADKIIKDSPNVIYNKDVHKYGHTLEIQIPFLQAALGNNFKILPILFGNTKTRNHEKLAKTLARYIGENDLVVVSTDLSHYPSYHDANLIDQNTLKVIQKADINLLEQYIKDIERKNIKNEETVACGIDGIKIAIELYNILKGNSIEILKYANSGDVSMGDKSRVVGYGALIFLKENKEDIMQKKENLTSEEKNILMEIARGSIREAVLKEKFKMPEITSSRLKEKCGGFVTLKKHGSLRGCIGYIAAEKPLYETVNDMAKFAAIKDPRFRPVTKDEINDLDIEISALTPLRKIDNIEEIEVGKHGLMIRKGFFSGLLLPQVAQEYGWDKETFLRETCNKAGLSKDAWKDPSCEIYIFSAEVFGE